MLAVNSLLLQYNSCSSVFKKEFQKRLGKQNGKSGMGRRSELKMLI